MLNQYDLSPVNVVTRNGCADLSFTDCIIIDYFAVTLSDSLRSSGPRHSPLFWHDAYCSGREYNILNCNFSRTYSLSFTSTNNNILSTYNDYEAAAVVCRGNSSRSYSECERGAVRLGNFTHTPKIIEGRVEICDNGLWKGICDNLYGFWGGRQTRLVCEQLLGHASKGKYWIM